jgi:hypothetical protein
MTDVFQILREGKPKEASSYEDEDDDFLRGGYANMNKQRLRNIAAKLVDDLSEGSELAWDYCGAKEVSLEAKDGHHVLYDWEDRVGTRNIAKWERFPTEDEVFNALEKFFEQELRNAAAKLVNNMSKGSEFDFPSAAAVYGGLSISLTEEDEYHILALDSISLPTIAKWESLPSEEEVFNALENFFEELEDEDGIISF